MKKINFKIERLDRFAQGVHFGDKTTFIERALPGETGEASITRSAKGVAFATVENITATSRLRVSADCDHYNECQGCHYRHVSYEDELSFKKESFSFELRNFVKESGVEVETLSLSRKYYRNRLQLHYHKKAKALGLINKQTKRIVDIPKCVLGNELVRAKLDELYKNKQWLTLARDQPSTGHLEVYEQENQVRLNWNKSYAHGGFSQVNTKLNEKLHKWIEKNISNNSTKTLLDLFGGEGNLSNALHFSKRYVVDLYSKDQQQRLSSDEFIHLDLEEAQASSLKISPLDLMVIDPPRRGFLKIQEWVETFSPENILYVSCDIGSLKRDIKKIEDRYTVKKALMIDFFGGTYHYESLVYLSRKF